MITLIETVSIEFWGRRVLGLSGELGCGIVLDR